MTVEAMESEPILLRRDRGNGIVHLTLNRPKSFNSLSSGLMAALQDEMDGIAEDPEARVVIIEGAGPGFCAGHDLKEVTSFETVEARRALMAQCCKLMLSVVHCPKPVIAKVHGVAAAAGCQLVASCDLAVAADEARFITPGVNIGLFCSTPMVALGRNVARKHAMEMLLTGEAMDAPTAHRFGLINRHVPAGELDDGVMRFAELIASKSSYTLRVGKEAFYRQMDMELEEAYKMASEVMVENMLAADAHEGMTAFVEKRKPVWRDQ
ncbi:MAG: enoyl-CoA hydratase [Rhodospirillaceae bacterium]|jgi:enoyl-CoA hydratase/carnithine racemase|nr:enoyl-CoA hydratase [Rhodospirillaceae bacterium]MBT6428797.1 enoyl-CoA hydratase [Rhodospirillaceae bacterium]MBT7758526.1 enoyl-CoA hydratase [Rhodospirillaceae bacterium]